MNTSQRLRMSAMESLIKEYGYISRKVLCDLFGVSGPQVTRDLSVYREFAPANLNYNTSMKRYERAPVFEPKFLMHTVEPIEEATDGN